MPACSLERTHSTDLPYYAEPVVDSGLRAIARGEVHSTPWAAIRALPPILAFPFMSNG